MASESKPSTHKLDNEVIAETIDNKASVKDIFLTLASKCKIKSQNIVYYLRRIMFQNRLGDYQDHHRSHFEVPGHPLTAFDSDWDGSLPAGFFEQFSHASLLPRIITKDVRNIGKEDPVTQLLREFYYFKRDWIIAKQIYSRSKGRKPYKWMEGNVLHCPEYFIDLAKKLDEIPDPYFSAHYNWYYAGRGNLHVVSFFGTEYLLHADFSNLFITPFSKENQTIDCKNSISYECEEGMNILETVTSLQFIALRTKFKIIIITVDMTDDGISLEKIKEIDSKWPFTSITFDEYHENILYVTTLEWQLTIVNLDRLTYRTVKLRGKYTTLTDNWSSVIGSERGYYIHMNQSSITLYDKRTNEAYKRWKSLKDLVDVKKCDTITSGAYCKGRPQMYIGTRHHIFTLDMRSDKTSQNKLKAVQRWVHGMKTPPIYVSVVENAEYNKDMVCLSSQWLEDMILLRNHSDVLKRLGKPTSVGLPYRPPSLITTYKNAQLQRMCCDIYEPIEDRLVSTISGMSMWKYGEDSYKVLMMNSLGDISSHNIYPKHLDLHEDGPELLHEWSKNTFDIPKQEYCYIYDVSRLWSSLKKIPEDYELCLKNWDKVRHNYSENEIYSMFHNNEVDSQFLELWKENMALDGEASAREEMEVDMIMDEDDDEDMMLGMSGDEY